MAGNRMIEDNLRVTSPHTFSALQKLVPSMASVAKNAGKTSFFGRDKGADAYEEFVKCVKLTVLAMMMDRVVRESSTSREVAVAMAAKLEMFAMAFPNWQDAYGVARIFFDDQGQDAIALIDRVRSSV